jgi:hypothetical protein
MSEPSQSLIVTNCREGSAFALTSEVVSAVLILLRHIKDRDHHHIDCK